MVRIIIILENLILKVRNRMFSIQKIMIFSYLKVSYWKIRMNSFAKIVKFFKKKRILMIILELLGIIRIMGNKGWYIVRFLMILELIISPFLIVFRLIKIYLSRFWINRFKKMEFLLNKGFSWNLWKNIRIYFKCKKKCYLKVKDDKY